MSSELFEKGLAVRKEVLGAAYVEKSIGGADEFAIAICYGRMLGSNLDASRFAAQDSQSGQYCDDFRIESSARIEATY